MTLNEISKIVLSAAIEVHQCLGPGMLEKTYKLCLQHELQLRGIKVIAEVSLAITYKGINILDAYRIDLLVEDVLVVEVKAVNGLTDVHKAQTLTYLRTGDYRLGLLINFNHPRLMDGYVRIANGM